MKLSLKILGGCILASSFFACHNKVQEESCEVINLPNKDSELALLMRELTKDTEHVKSQIQKGETPVFFTEFENLHTAIPTDTFVREDGKYTAFTNIFIKSVKNLLLTEDDQVDAYNFMIKQCIDCHKQICPGPIRRIKKLHIK